MMEDIKIKFYNTSKEIFEPANYHAVIKFFDTHMMLECNYGYRGWNEDLGMMNPESNLVHECIMFPKAYNITPFVDYMDKLGVYRLCIDSSLTNFTNLSFRTYEEAKAVLEKIIKWKFS
jgi:hypothetical protein